MIGDNCLCSPFNRKGLIWPGQAALSVFRFLSSLPIPSVHSLESGAGSSSVSLTFISQSCVRERGDFGLNTD